MNRLPESMAELVHARSVEILGEVGFCVPEQEALARLETAGFPVDQDSQMVRLTSELLDEALSLLPHDVCLYVRSGTTPVPFAHDLLTRELHSGQRVGPADRCAPLCHSPGRA